MARTTRRKPHRFYSHEGTVARAMTRRKRRADQRAAMQRGHFEAMPVHKGTQGWITW